MKVVINTCFGGFSLSEKAYLRLVELGIPLVEYDEGIDGEVIYKPTAIIDRLWDSWTRDGENRTHPLLVQVVEELGEAAEGARANLKIVEIPDEINFTIEDYDGVEHIAEVHRTWS